MQVQHLVECMYGLRAETLGEIVFENLPEIGPRVALADRHSGSLGPAHAAPAQLTEPQRGRQIDHRCNIAGDEADIATEKSVAVFFGRIAVQVVGYTLVKQLPDALGRQLPGHHVENGSHPLGRCAGASTSPP